MKQLATVALAAVMLSAGAAQAVEVGVSVHISQPGVYGRVDIGRFPQPQIIVQQPVIVHRPVRVVRAEPVYMWVPPGHRKNWRKHCGRYDACGVPVYFVQDGWYDKHVKGGKHHRDHDERGGRGKGHGGRHD